VRRRLSHTETQRLVDNVAQAIRDGQPPASAAGLAAGWEQLERALRDGKYPSLPIVRPDITPWYLRGIVFVSMILGVGLTADWLRHQREPTPLAPLHFVLQGTSVEPEQRIAARPDAPAELVFSDESKVTLAPSARIAVLAMDAHGARLALASGELEVAVTPRSDSSWRFEAGPFRVAVKGTAFHLGYEAARGRLRLQMHKGVVEVSGPAPARRLTLRAGESVELFATAVAATPPAAEVVLGTPAGPAADLPPSVASASRPSARRPRPRGGDKAMDSRTAGQAGGAWSRLIARGEFAAVVREAEARGLDVTLAQASAAELTSLADAARYIRRDDVARRALLRLRERFAGTSHSSDAAFFLGRLAEGEPSASASPALRWYETYLRESARGPYAGEALGREIALCLPADRERASRIARQYLERFPHGSQADLARSLLQPSAE
jgi:hypothetical protein